MDEWHDFLLTTAGGAGVLTGLVFVGVSINLEKILADPNSGLTGRALEALILLVAVLIVSTLLLMPGQGRRIVVAEILTVGIGAWVWVSTIHMQRMRSWGEMAPDLRWPFVLRVVLGQVAALQFSVAGLAVLFWGFDGLYSLAVGMVFSILAALFGAWVLLVEINR